MQNEDKSPLHTLTNRLGKHIGEKIWYLLQAQEGRVRWVQVSVCGKLTLLALPEQSNSVAKPDLICVCVCVCAYSFFASNFSDFMLKLLCNIDTICWLLLTPFDPCVSLSNVQREECFHAHVIVSGWRSSHRGIEASSSMGHLKDIRKERHYGRALQPFIYLCWPCMQGLQGYFPTIPSAAI